VGRRGFGLKRGWLLGQGEVGLGWVEVGGMIGGGWGGEVPVS